MFSPYRFPILAMALLLILPGLSACQKTNAPSSQDLPQVSMVLTHEIATDLDITDITFIPNTLAHWLGKIALLDKQGRLFVTDIEGGKVVPVGTHTYRDMVGLLRPKAPGLLFALNTNGQIEAFREDDEDGRFHPLKVVSDSLELKQFCHPATLATDQISGLSAQGKLMNIRVRQNGSDIKLEAQPSPGARKGKCAQSSKISYRHPENTHLFIAENSENPKAKLQVMIKDGLLNKGMEEIRAIGVTSSNFGRTYSDGVIAVIDNANKRIGFIALDYANQQIKKAGPDTTNKDQ